MLRNLGAAHDGQFYRLRAGDDDHPQSPPRKAGEITGTLNNRIATVQRLYDQRRDSKNKLYTLHAPKVECIPKGKF